MTTGRGKPPGRLDIHLPAIFIHLKKLIENWILFLIKMTVGLWLTSITLTIQNKIVKHVF